VVPAKYQEDNILPEQLKAWESPRHQDTRLHLPELNKYIPTDFSLRCDDTRDIISDSSEVADDEIEVPPKLIRDTPSIRLWHKMDRYWRVPKAFVRAALLSPSIYASPRSMTLNRIYQRLLNDDLNSFVYDASIAGCNYCVSCTPQGYRVFVRGYSEKIPFLLETLTARMLSLIEEMKTGDQAKMSTFLSSTE
jgi:insulysin